MLKLLPLKYRLSAAIGLILLAGAFIVAGIVFPTAKRITALGEEIYETKKFIEKQYQRTKELKKSILNIDEVEQATRIFARTAIQPGEELRVITELEALAEAHHIAQSLSVRFNPGDPSFTFSFSNRGEFPDMIRYLRSMEQLPYYVFIDRLSWQRQILSRRSDVPEGALVLSFDAKIYMAQ